VSFLIGYFFFEEKSNIHKFCSVVVVTVGIFITVHAESQAKLVNKTLDNCDGRFEFLNGSSHSLAVQGCGKSSISQSPERNNHHEDETFEWFLGLLMLLGTLAMSALLGHLQSWGMMCN
jgi:hypothetical protein